MSFWYGQPVPSDHGLRLDDKQRRSPTSPKPREPNPQNAVSGSEIKAMSLLGALENQELLSQSENFSVQGRSRTKALPKHK
jgi:hypothetical protein